MPISVDDPDIAVRIRAGESEALQVVVTAYLEQILRAARGAGLSAADAEDVTQATFQVFIEKHANFDGRSHVRTWLFGILYKKIAEMRRQLRKNQRMDDIDEVVEQRFNADGTWMRPPRPVDADLNDAELRELIESCLEGLPDRQRLAFMLRAGEGFSTDETCKIMEVTRTYLGVLLFRARNRLRECLEAKDVRGD